LGWVRLQLKCGNQLIVGRADGAGHCFLLDGPLGRFTFFSVPLKL